MAAGSLPKTDDRTFQPRLREMLGDIDYFLRDLSRGVRRISDGEVPDGSGNQIGNGGTLTEYWFKPGIADPFIAYMSKAASAGGIISSTSDQAKGFIKFGEDAVPTMSIDESSDLVGINVAAPGAALHLQSGTSGTTTLVPSSDLDTKWDGPRDAASAITAGTLASAVNVNDGSTKWAGYSTSLGLTPQQFNMTGAITPGKTWTVNMYVCVLSGVWTTGDLEFRIRDSSGTEYSYVETGTFADALATFPTFRLKTFTINGAGTSTGAGTANSIKVGIAATTPVGAYCACTYIEITTGGSSDVARWNNDAASLFGKINASGYVGVGTGSDTLGAMLTVESDAAASIGTIIKGATSQSGNLQEWQSQAGAILSRIKSDGTFDGPISGTLTSPVSVADAGFSIFDDGNNTRIAKFQCSGISNSTTRTYTFPDANGTLALTTDIDTARTWQTLQTFKDTTFKLVDDGDATKTAVVSLGGATAGADLILALSSTADRTLTFSLAGTAGNDLTLAWTGTADQVITIPDGTATLAALELANVFTSTNVFEAIPGGSGGGPVTPGLFLIDNVAVGGPFTVEVTVLSAGLTADRTARFPDGSGDIVLTGATQTLLNKTLDTATVLRSSTASIGASFADNTTTTKRLRCVLSGAVGNNSFTLTNTAARNYGFGNIAGNVMVVGDDPPTVASGALGKVDLTGQVANITTTNLSSTPPAGVYAVEVYLQCTTNDVTAGTLTVTIGWTDDVGATTDAAAIAAFPLTATGRAKAVYAPLRVASGDITYAVAITGAYGTAAYAIHARTIYLG